MMASSSSSMASSAAAAAQRELEEKLTQSGTKLSIPPSSTLELLSLLENVESELRSIGQDPSVSMINVLDPIRKALIGTKLLGHSDEIIEVSVVSCICEIMRISAPVLPYDNREMKVIFNHIIASLEKLPDILSDCYSKAVRVLEAIAKIRLCVMLLDLDYILAVNVFQLFLKIIRPYHPHAVSKYMEDIMTQLIEESDEVSIDFQVSILESLRKKTMDTAPLSSLLGHHVLEKCAARLKPCLLELIKTMNLNFDDYTDILGSVCCEVAEGENTVENAGSVPPVEETSALPQVPQLDGTPTIMNNNNSSSDNAASKESASPPETGKQSMPDVLAPNSANTHVNSGSSRKRGRPKKNRTELTVNSGSSRKRGRPKKNRTEQTARKRSEGTSSPSLNVSIKKEKETSSDAQNSSLQQNDLQSISRRTRNARKQALNKEKVENAGYVPPVEGTSDLQLPQVPQLDGTLTIMNNNNNLEPDGSLKTLKHCNQAEQLKDTDAPSEPMRKNTKDLQQQMNVSGLSEKIRSDTGHDSFDTNESKSCVEEPTNKKEHEKKSGSSSDNAASKESASPSETGNQSMPDLLDPNSENNHVNSGSSCKRGQPKKNQTELTVRKRSEGTSSPSLTVSIKKEKETVSDAENSSLQQNDLQNISRRTKHSRKQALNKEKDSKKLRIIKDYGEELVGAKVRVWWPLDRKFYEGVISSFDPEIKKHKVKYTDDEEEILNLNRERWELLEEVSVKEEPVTDFPPELSVVSEKKAQGSVSTPRKNIKSEKAPNEDNNTLLSHNSKNIVIKEEAEDESTVPSNTLSEEPATDFLPEVSAIAGIKRRKGSSKKKESSSSSSEWSRKKARGSGSKPR